MLSQEVDRLVGKTPPAIQRYEREYLQDFRSIRPALSSKAELIEAVRQADVTFVADYHTYHQAQRTALRLIRDAIRPGENWLIGLELISSRYQRALDRFQAGEIDRETFHQAIRYQEAWGFPWSNYAEIFQWARDHGVRIIGLNRPKEFLVGSAQLRSARKDYELGERDLWSAGVIADYLAGQKANRNPNPPPKMIAVYGELHVGSRHLPAQLQKVSTAYGKKLNILVIHQNNDKLYWKFAGQGKELQSNVLKLRKNTYCVLSGTPWGKLQSLVNWAEGEATSEPDLLADYEEFEQENDFLHAIRIYGDVLAEFLDTAPASYENLSVQTIAEADFVDDQLRRGEFTSRELQLIRFHILSNQRLYIPRVHMAYLATPSQNSAAEMASLHLLREKTRSEILFAPVVEDFYRQVMEAAFGFFGSLLLNPKRKCDLPQDHRKRLRAIVHGDRELYRHEKMARTIALDFQAGKKRKLALETRMKDPYLAPALMMGARYSGQMLGQKLYQALRGGAVAPEVVRDLFLRPTRRNGDTYADRLSRLVEITAPEKLAPSKSHAL